MHVSLIAAVAITFTGLLAGMEVGVHYGLGAPPQTLTERDQILVRQAMVRRLRILAPMLFLPSLVLLVILTGLQRSTIGSLWLLLAAIVALAVWGAIRAVRTVPVNSATLEWNADEPPADWRVQVERTERFHVVATWAAVMAFLCLLTAGMLDR